jgi:hypothetical protein
MVCSFKRPLHRSSCAIFTQHHCTCSLDNVLACDLNRFLSLQCTWVSNATDLQCSMSRTASSLIICCLSS